MDSTVLVTLVSAGIAALTQVLKDRLNVKSESLRWGVAGVGLLTALGLSVAGDSSGTETLVNAVIGLLLPAGAHSVGLQGSVLGKTLKSLGGSVLKGKDDEGMAVGKDKLYITTKNGGVDEVK